MNKITTIVIHSYFRVKPIIKKERTRRSIFFIGKKSLNVHLFYPFSIEESDKIIFRYISWEGWRNVSIW
jgi:hypothetical protein